MQIEQVVQIIKISLSKIRFWKKDFKNNPLLLQSNLSQKLLPDVLQWFVEDSFVPNGSESADNQKKTHSSIFSSSSSSVSGLKKILDFVDLDEDIPLCFEKFSRNSVPLVIHLPPGCEHQHMSWADVVAEIRSSLNFAVPLIRVGWLSTIQDLVFSYKMGFSCVLMFAKNKDNAEMQYLTEVAIELKIDLVWICLNQLEFDLFLETDSPFVGFFGQDPLSGKVLWKETLGMLESCPKNVTAMVLASDTAEYSSLLTKGTRCRALVANFKLKK